MRTSTPFLRKNKMLRLLHLHQEVKTDAPTRAVLLEQRKKPGARIGFRPCLVANDPNCDTSEPPLALGGSFCAKGVHNLILRWNNLTIWRDSLLRLCFFIGMRANGIITLVKIPMQLVVYPLLNQCALKILGNQLAQTYQPYALFPWL